MELPSGGVHFSTTMNPLVFAVECVEGAHLEPAHLERESRAEFLEPGLYWLLFVSLAVLLLLHLIEYISVMSYKDEVPLVVECDGLMIRREST